MNNIQENQENLDKATSDISKKLNVLNDIRNSYVLTDKDFYPPQDDRIFKSGVSDIYGGDSYSDYAESFYNIYSDELFD